jgi:transcriptional regulator with PAS, ATPase and Fis domain
VNLGDLPPHVQKNRPPYQVAEEQKLYTRNISAFIQKNGLRKFMQAIEREAFSEIYTRTNQNLTKTQLALGISKSAAYRILESQAKMRGPAAPGAELLPRGPAA